MNFIRFGEPFLSDRMSLCARTSVSAPLLSYRAHLVTKATKLFSEEGALLCLIDLEGIFFLTNIVTDQKLNFVQNG